MITCEHITNSKHMMEISSETFRRSKRRNGRNEEAMSVRPSREKVTVAVPRRAVVLVVDDPHRIFHHATFPRETEKKAK